MLSEEREKEIRDHYNRRMMPPSIGDLLAEIERLRAEAKETNDIYIKNFEQQRRDYVELAKAYAEALKKLDALKPFPKGKLTNSGHGHVYSRLDGSIARCGGPGLCGKCSADLARKLQDEDDASNNTLKE